MRTFAGAFVTTVALAVSAAAATPAVAPAPKPFEGVIGMTVDHGGKARPMTYSIKAQMTRMDVPAGEGTAGGAVMIFDGARQLMLMLMPEQKRYMIMPVPRNQPAPGSKTPAPKVTKTGRSETILGYLCEEWKAEDENGYTEIWAAKGLGLFAPMGGGMGHGGPPAERPAWEQEMTRGRFFPLRVVRHDAKGDPRTTMNVTAIEPKVLPVTLFQPPKDYKKFEMPAGMGGAMGGRPGR